MRLFEEIDRSKWLWYLPLSEMPDEALAGIKTLWLEWLADHTTDTFGFTKSHAETDVPTLSLTGWYDQQIGAIKNFTGMRANGMTEESRQAARLIVGPWTHSDGLNRHVGEIDFGAEAQRDYVGLCLEWFDRWLKQDGASPAAEWPPIQLFVMGENRWRSENEWPLARTRYVDYYLHSDGGASTPGGDGVLSTAAPSEEPQDGYEYDPRDPLMTLYSPNGQQEPHDQRILDSRRDVLVYQTPPLHEAVEVTGPITVKLFAASLCVGHRLGCQTSRCLARRLHSGVVLRNSAGPVQKRVGCTRASDAWRNLRIQHYGQSDEQSFQGRAPHTPRYHEQRLPQLRP